MSLDLQSSYVSMDRNDSALVSGDSSMTDAFNRFNWFNKLIAIAPMWVSKHSNRRDKNKWCNVIGILHVFMISAYVTGWTLHQGYLILSESVELYGIMFVISPLCLFVSKLMSMVYYAYTFDYPWISDTNKATSSRLPNNTFKMKILSTKRRLIAFLTVYMIACSIHYFGEFMDFPTVIMNNLFLISMIYSFAIPIAISQCCISLILLQYELFLRKLIHILEFDAEKNMDCMTIINEYKTNLFSFQKECKFWQWYVGFKVFALLIWIWIYLTYLIHDNGDIYLVIYSIVGIVFWSLPFIELVIASSHLSNAFWQLKAQLLFVQGKQLEEENMKQISNRELQEFNHLYNYICAHRMVFKLFGSELNLSNGIKLSVFFVLAKMISYSFYNI